MLAMLTIALIGIVHLANAVTFQALYERELRSSYGFEILKYYHDEQFGNEDVKKFKGESMLFLTPWREDGIGMALKFMKKFDYFCPCYYDFRKKNQSIILDTSEHYSQEYLRKVKEANPNVKIVPRLYVQGLQGDVFLLASTEDEQMEIYMNHVKDIINNPYYDGIVFSSPFITPNHKYPFSIRNIIKKMRQPIDAVNKSLMIMLEGVDNKPDQKVMKKKAREIMELADKIIISNFDYPKGNQGVTIPISPMDWIAENYQFYCEVYSKSKLDPKLIMAIPLYGYFVALYGKYDPIEGREMLQKLEKQKQAYLDWNEDIKECMIYLNKMEYIYYPCLHFLDARLRYFEQLGVGVAGFEIGSSLEILLHMF